LARVQPPALPNVVLSLVESDTRSKFRPARRIQTTDGLANRLSCLRRSHERFLRELAPPIESRRQAIRLCEFDWRLEDPGRRTDIARLCKEKCGWQRIRVPHYGPPLGRAIAYYRTSFELDPVMIENRSLFVRFKGADYKAHVFVNGAYLASHEGFFAPFDVDFTCAARAGENQLLVVLENDAILMGNGSWGPDGHKYEGDKIYAATGPGYDDPEVGWHHCPPGMGIYQDVVVESTNTLHISDLFVRPLPEDSRAEAWIEVYNSDVRRLDARIELSIWGLNFRKLVLANKSYPIPGSLGPGVNYLRFAIDMTGFRKWDTSTPWLYQLQAFLKDGEGRNVDAATSHFGMRSFRISEESEPKGAMYLNGLPVRLRGANTMGFEQLSVMRGDRERLIDDILLAKACNLNFWRLTQRPVQSEVYDYCDRLGLMTQTDLPLFGVLRRNKFCEAVKQAEEMERLVRSHPCNVVVSFINEPFPNGRGRPHRHLTKPEMERFFAAASQAVLIANPDRAIKPVDGDYDPPSPGLPDNHCYCGWYGNHGLDLGMLHRGYWQNTKPGWHYGCGEFGAEGLDFPEVMRKHYPASWLPQSPAEEAEWTPSRIPKSQTSRFHYLWFETPSGLEEWVKASQRHQARIIRMLTEAFRRDARMVSFAVHLFIDAFPSGWMKALMDVERNPKPAFFEYMHALTPLAANLRTDRFSFFSGETVAMEAWICNDLTSVPDAMRLHCQLELGGRVIAAHGSEVVVPRCGSAFQGFVRFRTPEVDKRTRAVVRVAVLDSFRKTLHDSCVNIDIHPRPEPLPEHSVALLGEPTGAAARLADELSLSVAEDLAAAENGTILIDSYAGFQRNCAEVMHAVRHGARAVFLELPEGDYRIAEEVISVVGCGMGPRHFVSRDTGHPLVRGFQREDFQMWFDPDLDRVAPLLNSTFTAPGWNAVLTTGNGDWRGEWHRTLAVAERQCGGGSIIVCQLCLAGRTQHNPVAREFAERLVGWNRDVAK
jgi:hypothetical protein